MQKKCYVKPEQRAKVLLFRRTMSAVFATRSGTSTLLKHATKIHTASTQLKAQIASLRQNCSYVQDAIENFGKM